MIGGKQALFCCLKMPRCNYEQMIQFFGVPLALLVLAQSASNSLAFMDRA